MNSIAIKTDFLKEAVKKVKADIKLDSKKNTSVVLSPENKDLFDFLQENFPLTAAQSSKINSFFCDRSKLAEAKVDSVNSFYSALCAMNGSDEPTLEIKINNRWYPVLSSISKFKGRDAWFGELTINAGIGSINFRKRIFLGDWLFEDAGGKKVKKQINDVLKNANIRLTTADAISETKNKASKLFEFLSYENKVFDATSVGLVYNDFWGWSDISVGWKDSPSSVIIEPTLENEYATRERDGGWKLPFVRVFSLKHKDYVFVDIDDLEPHTYHREGKDKIFLPPKMMTAINSIFDAKQDNIFGDLFHGRHGGIVVLANGPSGVGKCLGKGTPVLLADGSIQPVENIKIGDRLLGPDGVVKNVLSTNVGNGPLFRIDPIKGDSWVCNDVHVLTLRNCSTGKVIDISLDEWQKSSKNFKNLHKLFTVGVDNFIKPPTELPIDPYFLGVWFGDGTKHIRQVGDKEYLNDVSISNTDQEVIGSIYSYAEKWNMRVREKIDGDKCPQYFLVNKDADNKDNVLLNVLRDLVGKDVTIPVRYLTSSREERLQFLAGYLDADGELSNNCYVISQKRNDWAQAIVFLAKSLGFCATITKRKAGCTRPDGSYFEGEYNVVTISGHTDDIPVKILYKKASERRQIKHPNHTGFSVSPVGEGEYYGFTLDGDGRFLLGDFTVTHNTLTAEVFAEYQSRPLYTMEMGEVGTNLETVEMNLNKIFARAKKWNAVLLFDEADIFLSERVASDLERSAIVGIFLRLLDYYEGTFFLTTNRGEGIDKAFKSRVTLYLNYPDLTEDLRSKIWNSMLKAAGMEVINDSRVAWGQITNVSLNGRQIRNQVRLLRLMYPTGVVSTLDIQNSLEFAAK